MSQFWINHLQVFPEASISQFVTVDLSANCFTDDEYRIHVIEYSAYEALREENDKLNDDCQQLRSEIERLEEYGYAGKLQAKLRGLEADTRKLLQALEQIADNRNSMDFYDFIYPVTKKALAEFYTKHPEYRSSK